jgi:hypothetical protein
LVEHATILTRIWQFNSRSYKRYLLQDWEMSVRSPVSPSGKGGFTVVPGPAAGADGELSQKSICLPEAPGCERGGRGNWAWNTGTGARGGCPDRSLPPEIYVSLVNALYNDFCSLFVGAIAASGTALITAYKSGEPLALSVLADDCARRLRARIGRRQISEASGGHRQHR